MDFTLLTSRVVRDTYVLFHVTEFELICYSRLRKLIQCSNLKVPHQNSPLSSPSSIGLLSSDLMWCTQTSPPPPSSFRISIHLTEPPFPESLKAEPKALPNVPPPTANHHQTPQCLLSKLKQICLFLSISMALCLRTDPFLKSILYFKAKMSLLTGKPAQAASVSDCPDSGPSPGPDKALPFPATPAVSCLEV